MTDKPNDNLKPPLADAIGSEMRQYINRTPVLISLLYSLNLLPEQVEEGTVDWRRMMVLAAWWRKMNSTLPNKQAEP